MIWFTGTYLTCKFNQFHWDLSQIRGDMTEFWLHFCIFVNRRSLLFVPAVSSFNSSADYKTLREAKPGADLQHCLKPNQEEVKGLKATLCAAFFAFFFRQWNINQGRAGWLWPGSWLALHLQTLCQRLHFGDCRSEQYEAVWCVRLTLTAITLSHRVRD